MRKELLLPGVRRKPWKDWLIAAGFVSLMFALIGLFGDLRYFNNDDACILRPFMGYATSTLPTFHLYLNALLVYPLRWLGMAFPGVAWFSYMQLFFLWLACTVSFKSILRCFANAGKPLWLGMATAVAYLAAFGMTYSCVVTYTVTAGMLGAAAVLQILSADCRNETDGQIIRAMMLGLLLVLLAYSLRQITALPILPFCAVALLYQGVSCFGVGNENRRNWKPLILTAIIVVAVIGSLAGIREIEINAKGMRGYLRWQQARISVMDYGGTKNLPDEVLDRIGWSRAELDMVDNWYFLDSNITAEAFETIAAYQKTAQDTKLSEKLADSADAVSSLVSGERLFTRTLLLLAGVIALTALSLLFRPKGTGWLWLTLGVTLAGTVVMVLALGTEGRLPLRAALVVVLPAAAMLFGLLPGALPQPADTGRAPKAILYAIACGCAAVTLWYAIPAAGALAPTPESEIDESTLSNAFADLDELALQNPDLLYIYDSTFASDYRMFPDTTAGIPTNVMFWGGWSCRSPEYVAQLKAFGIDADHLDATVFFKDNVRLARGLIDPEPNDLIAYLRELQGDDFDYTFDDEWGGVHTLQFYTYDDESD